MRVYGTRVLCPWIRHDASLAHDIPGHPERPQRLAALERALAADGWPGLDAVEAPAATREQLLRVHPARHLDLVEGLCARGGGAIDMDTACIPETWPAALHAAGGAVALVDALLGEDARAGFAALRPPGHHAEAERAMGFCFLNNVAVAATHAREAHGAERVLIFDWDVHHGNGTEEIFLASSDVLLVSVHQWPLYPGTGAAEESGCGAGRGYTVNVPVPSGSGDDVYGSVAEHLVGGLIRTWRPQLVLVSAGFDAHRLDPLASCRMTGAGYAAMTASLRAACADAGAPLGLLLEGGYSIEALVESVRALLPVLSTREVPTAPVVDLHPLAAAAVERVAPYFGSILRA